MPDSVADALLDVAPARNVEAQPVADREALAQAADEARRSTGSRARRTKPTKLTRLRRAHRRRRNAADRFEAGVTAEGSFADGSDARDGDRTGDTSDGENADDTDDPDGGIDFDEPFDEGIDVLDSRPDSGPVPGPNPNPAPDPNPEQADSGVRADADGGVTEVEVGVEDAKIDDEDAGDAATRKERETPRATMRVKATPPRRARMRMTTGTTPTTSTTGVRLRRVPGGAVDLWWSQRGGSREPRHGRRRRLRRREPPRGAVLPSFRAAL